jgi:hypothetical protein
MVLELNLKGQIFEKETDIPQASGHLDRLMRDDYKHLH